MRERGFSLIEVLVATAILMFVVIGILTMFSSRMTLDKFSKNRMIALSLAQEAIEYLRALPVEKLPEYDNKIQDYGEIPSYPRFRREFYVTSNFPAPGLYDVRVVVRWKTAGGYGGDVTLRTMIKERE